jgi:branched-chain amino acid transport system permease protein
MEVFVQQLINGITLGSIYGLIAIGYTMVFGIIGMVNFAHGDVFMVSAFIALIAFLVLTTWLGIGSVMVALFIVLIVAMLLTSLLNWTIERVAYRPLRGSFLGAADFGHRHVDLPDEFRAGGAGTAQQVDPAVLQ